jgi:hypothetical protein
VRVVNCELHGEKQFIHYGACELNRFRNDSGCVQQWYPVVYAALKQLASGHAVRNLAVETLV